MAHARDASSPEAVEVVRALVELSDDGDHLPARFAVLHREPFR